MVPTGERDPDRLSPAVEPSKLYIDHAPVTLAEFQDWWDNMRILGVSYFSLDADTDNLIGLSRPERGDEWSSEQTFLFTSQMDLLDKDVSVVQDDDVKSLGHLLRRWLRRQTQSRFL